MQKIDVHSHFHDPYIEEALSRIFKENRVAEKMGGGTRTGSAYETPEQRLKSMDRGGVDIAAIEYQMVWQRYNETEYPWTIRTKISRMINDRLADVCRKYPARYWMLADMPLPDVGASLEELKRVHGLGAKGVCLFTNYHGKALTIPEFTPFWEELNKLGLPVFLHPRECLNPARPNRTDKYPNIVNYPFETTLAAADLLMDDFFTKYQHINIMLSHCGGALPFLKTRLEIPRLYGDKRLDDMLNKFFYDTGVSFPQQLKFTADVVGADCVCYGVDYPYWAFERVSRIVEDAGFSGEEKEKVFYQNAMRFFGV